MIKLFFCHHYSQPRSFRKKEGSPIGDWQGMKSGQTLDIGLRKMNSTMKPRRNLRDFIEVNSLTKQIFILTIWHTVSSRSIVARRWQNRVRNRDWASSHSPMKASSGKSGPYRELELLTSYCLHSQARGINSSQDLHLWESSFDHELLHPQSHKHVGQYMNINPYPLVIHIAYSKR